jgi:hypothetical protein
MKISILMMFLVLLLGACSKQSAAEREALDKAKPSGKKLLLAMPHFAFC